MANDRVHASSGNEVHGVNGAPCVLWHSDLDGRIELDKGSTVRKREAPSKRSERYARGVNDMA